MRLLLLQLFESRSPYAVLLVCYRLIALLPLDAASEKVTPPGAVPSFPTAVSVPLMAETPRPICISVDDDDVFDEIHTLAF